MKLQRHLDIAFALRIEHMAETATTRNSRIAAKPFEARTCSLSFAAGRDWIFGLPAPRDHTPIGWSQSRQGPGSGTALANRPAVRTVVPIQPSVARMVPGRRGRRPARSPVEPDAKPAGPCPSRFQCRLSRLDDASGTGCDHRSRQPEVRVVYNVRKRTFKA
jgi:hypothetical protein